MFLQNKYTVWYYSIIAKSKHRINEGYVEKHHIIPVSLGGLDSVENIATLTAREHFICHLLLTKMVLGVNKYKMTKAARMLSTAVGPGQKRYKVTSKIYEIIKTDITVPHETRLKMSLSQKQRFSNRAGTFAGRKHSAETRNKIREARLGKKDSDEVRLIKSLSAKNRPPVTDDTRLKLSNATKGRPGLYGDKNGFYGKHHSEEQRERKRQEKLNSPRQECPYCSKIIDVMNFSRWHGDKCKGKL